MLQELVSLLGFASSPPDFGRIFALVLVALLVGMTKAGISGASMLAIPLLAASLGAKESTGPILLLLIAGDLFAVNAYRKDADRKEILRVLPAAFTGIVAGALTGGLFDARQFKWAIAVVVLVCLALMVYQEFRKGGTGVPRALWIALLFGALSGFASMIGNAAGPIFAVYLLSMRYEKSRYLGTFAVTFLLINLLKLPFQIFLWHNIGWSTLLLALILLPLVGFGLWAGVKLMKVLPEKVFRWLIIAMTAASAIRLLLP